MVNQFELEQKAKRLELMIGIALREHRYDDADDLNDDLYVVHRVLDIANRNAAR